MPSETTGGVAAAAGLGFQYLATIDCVLDWLESDDADFTLTTEDSRNEAIDFSVSAGGSLVLVAQAKATVDISNSRAMSLTELLRIAGKLLEQESRDYLIRTNRRLSDEAQRFVDLIGSLPASDSARQVRQQTAGLLGVDDFVLEPLSDDGLRRLCRMTVTAQPESCEELGRRIADRVQSMRRRTADGSGADSARVLLHYLTSEILFRSGTKGNRAMSRTQVVDLLGISSRTIAHSLGRYDWGEVSGAVPTTQTIRRDGLLDDMLRALDGPPDERVVRRLVLIGLSGIGKSSLAASYCEVAAPRYDKTVWFDASSGIAIGREAAAVLGKQAENLVGEELARLWREALTKDPKSWLLVFDNASRAANLDNWIPARGHVDVVVTSTNATAWNQWPTCQISAMEPDQAVALIRLRLGDAQWTESMEHDASRLAHELECWPLAIELACVFLGQSGRGIAVSDRYLELLADHVIDEPTLVPTSYRSHPTLLAAIHLALETVLVSSRHSGSALTPVSLMRVLCWFPPRHAPVEIAARVGIFLQANGDPDPELTSDHEAFGLVVDNAIRGLAAASLVEVNRTAGVIGRTVRTNAIVLHVARNLESAESRTVMLTILQVTLRDALGRALDEERFPYVHGLIPSCLEVLGHAGHSGDLGYDGVLLEGNVATYWLGRGEFQAALSAFERELSLVNERKLESYPLRAKIHAGMLAAKLHLGSAKAELSREVESAVEALERAVQASSGTDGLRTCGEQILDCLRILAESPTFRQEEHVSGWLDRITTCLPGARTVLPVAEYETELRRFGNDDEATLRKIDQQLSVETGIHQRTILLFDRADCLAVAQRFDEAATALQRAADQALDHALGLTLGLIPTLNAWQSAAIALLVGPDRQDALRLCEQAAALTAQHIVPTPDQEVQLRILRAATVAQRGPMPGLASYVSGIDRAGIVPTHLMTNVDPLLWICDACERILAVRQQIGGAPLLRVRAWGLVGIDGVRACLLDADADTLHDQRAALAQGRWLVSADGVGFAAGERPSTAFWMPLGELGWLRPAFAGIDPAAQRLHDLVTSTDGTRPDVVLVGSTSSQEGATTGTWRMRFRVVGTRSLS